MKRMLATMIFGLVALPGFAQDPTTWLSTLPQAKEYVQKRSSSYDRSGGTRMRAPWPREKHLRCLTTSGPD